MGVRVRVEGVVQGVGFRPFVHGLATGLGLAGLVGNDARGVFVELEGGRREIEEFLHRLERDAPPLAAIERVTVTSGVRAARPEGGFLIVESDPSGLARALVSPDIATCADCLAELADPADRRYRYPFVNCVHCGPRLTIVRGLPYDRPLTTMAGFAMCADCLAEYHDPADRRFHAQPICCPACGPSLSLVGAPGEPLAGAAAVLRAGGVLAVKGVGGYHLAVLAADQSAAATLRRRKRRADKPFAVMVADLDAARRLCEVDAVAAELLADRARPIVLLPRRADAEVADPVAPGNRQLGVLLPYTPLHHLLLAEVAAPIVLTSGNTSDEPIAYDDHDALERLGGIADAFLTHDRPIQQHADDSVVRPFRGQALPLRRSRGHAPRPIMLPGRAPRQILGCGAAQKNTFCLVKGRRAIVSPHFGDLADYATLRAYTEGIARFQALFGVRPEVVAHDLHPEYPATRYAMELPDVALAGVQHHHAHIASCLADNGESGRVIGVAFDGLGYGLDGTLWGGEFLLADLASFERAGHLAPVPMPGGEAAIRQPWRMAAAYLDGEDESLAVARRNERWWPSVTALARGAGTPLTPGARTTSGAEGGTTPGAEGGTTPGAGGGTTSGAEGGTTAGVGGGAPLTSSAGRLFDAVAALVGVRDTVAYEGQAAIELEQLADPAERGGYPAAVSGGAPGPFVVSGADLVRAAAADLRAGVAPAVVSARFHNGVSDLVVACCRRLREETGLTAVALSGGVFQNMLLARRTVELLDEAGFRVLTHTRVPPNDGGISLGQAAVAAARDLDGAQTHRS
ncbi:carbamoyltransferase HypF [Nonomuraea jiangxiensis]|uniref:Carbamoyltransferase n=1 Tax=Nonomuraea jiangxiensis TaxID=633440 RepID=A0A1G8T6C0_9ACTN|nr:carbamoyltransferase HypF [Nonomuraea jiangxiensis]SDJ37048.1 hydrogenase maturation protein HypF [Nonomuraea jiangxiensis]